MLCITPHSRVSSAGGGSSYGFLLALLKLLFTNFRVNNLIAISGFLLWLLWIDVKVWVFEMLVLMLPPVDVVLFVLLHKLNQFY
jgi:hypothetical protein